MSKSLFRYTVLIIIIFNFVVLLGCDHNEPELKEDANLVELESLIYNNSYFLGKEEDGRWLLRGRFYDGQVHLDSFPKQYVSVIRHVLHYDVKVCTWYDDRSNIRLGKVMFNPNSAPYEAEIYFYPQELREEEYCAKMGWFLDFHFTLPIYWDSETPTKPLHLIFKWVGGEGYEWDGYFNPSKPSECVLDLPLPSKYDH